MSSDISEKHAKDEIRRKKRIWVPIAAAVLILILAAIFVVNPFYRQDAFGATGVSPYLVDKIVVKNAEDKTATVTDKAAISKITKQLERYQLKGGLTLTDMMGLQYRVDLYEFGEKRGSVYFTDGAVVLAESKIYNGKTDTAFLKELFPAKNAAA